MNNLYNEKIEGLISAALADGVLTEKEKQVLFKKAQAEGIDLDEFEMVLDGRLAELKKKEVSAPKSNKYGDVRKCPACGVIVPALTGACPECGFEFSGIEANLSSQKLAEKLLETKTNDNKKIIIETFPIPNTKADLFEFITTLQPRMKDKNDPLSSTYLKKYEECIIKAKGMFPNDVNLRPFIESFEVEKEKKHKKILFRNIICIAISVIIVLLIVYRYTSGDRAKERIEQAIQSGNTTSIISEIDASPIFDSTNVNLLIQKLIDKNYLDAAIMLYEKNKPSYRIYGELNLKSNVRRILYNALIDKERMDEAWNYKMMHKQTATGYEKREDYLEYMSDVVKKYCSHGKKNDARQFVSSHIDWFTINIEKSNFEYEDDQTEVKKIKKEWGTANVRRQLIEIINNY